MIKIYHDPEGTQEITADNPDFIHKAVPVGNVLEDIVQIYLLSDDPTLTYENIHITADNDDDGATSHGQIDVKYSLDGATYKDTLEIPDGDFATAVAVYRKVIAPDVQEAYKRTDILHKHLFEEYKK
mgnify:FL=1